MLMSLSSQKANDENILPELVKGFFFQENRRKTIPNLFDVSKKDFPPISLKEEKQDI